MGRLTSSDNQPGRNNLLIDDGIEFETRGEYSDGSWEKREVGSIKASQENEIKKITQQSTIWENNTIFDRLHQPEFYLVDQSGGEKVVRSGDTMQQRKRGREVLLFHSIKSKIQIDLQIICYN